MWKGKLKAFTLSFDDGVWQDKRLISIINKYQLKGTFNLNFSLFGLKKEIVKNSKIICKDVVKAHEVAKVYKGHEVASHTLTHPHLSTLDEQSILYQIEQDRKSLEKIVGYSICGLAYPYGDYNDSIMSLLNQNTPIKYARTAECNYSFTPQENLLKFNPTVHFLEWEKLYELAEDFINSKCTKPQIFYVWGHSYELDFLDGNWEKFEEFCKYISARENIYYGTNKNVLLFED